MTYLEVGMANLQALVTPTNRSTGASIRKLTLFDSTNARPS